MWSVGWRTSVHSDQAMTVPPALTVSHQNAVARLL
jgi:hypothetical protein